MDKNPSTAETTIAEREGQGRWGGEGGRGGVVYKGSGGEGREGEIGSQYKITSD